MRIAVFVRRDHRCSGGEKVIGQFLGRQVEAGFETIIHRDPPMTRQVF